MLRLLLLSTMLFAAVYLLRRLFAAPAPPPRPQARKQINTRMVKCAHCGVYVPEDTAVKLPDKIYCSEEHRDAAG